MSNTEYLFLKNEVIKEVKRKSMGDALVVSIFMAILALIIGYYTEMSLNEFFGLICIFAFVTILYQGAKITILTAKALKQLNKLYCKNIKVEDAIEELKLTPIRFLNKSSS